MPKRISAIEADDFLIPVQLLIADGGSADPTDDDVFFAFVPTTQTTQPDPDSDFHEGFWLTQGAGVLYVAGITVKGPNAPDDADGLELDVGKYNGWIWVVDSPTQPIKPVDTLEIYSGAG